MNSLKSLGATFVIALAMMGALGYLLLVAAAIQRSPWPVAAVELFLFFWLIVHFVTNDKGEDEF